MKQKFKAELGSSSARTKLIPLWDKFILLTSFSCFFLAGCQSTSHEETEIIHPAEVLTPPPAQQTILAGPTGGKSANTSIELANNLYYVRYDLLGAPFGADIVFQVSSDNGRHWFQPTHVEGDIGKNIAGGAKKQFTWNYKLDFPNGLNSKFEIRILTQSEINEFYGIDDYLLIQGECFLMGSPDYEDNRDGDEKQKEVCLKSFYMSKYEVTNQQFHQFKPIHNSSTFKNTSLNDDQQPVVNVSWQDATNYAQWLTDRTGIRYRLPTEAEWEFAARSGRYDDRWFWGNKADTSCQYANLKDISTSRQWNWKNTVDCDDNNPTTSIVGQYNSNLYGLHDMIGNVWEWTCSDYNTEFNGFENRCSADKLSIKIMRGGSWKDSETWARTALRSRSTSTHKDSKTGFRLVMVK